MPIGRSKSHPGLNLAEAVAKAGALFDKDGRSFVGSKVAFTHWGYNEKSSGGRRTLSALLQFGLLEERGRGDEREIKLSRLALDILHDEQRRPDALKEAALTPELYNELWSLSEGQPPSREKIKHFCLVTHEFNPAGVEEFIDNFATTIEYAKLNETPIFKDEGEDNGNRVVAEKPDSLQSQGANMPQVQIQPDMKLWDFTIPLISGKGEAVVRIPYPISEEDFAFLSSMLSGTVEGMKRALTKKPEDGPSGN